MGVGVCSGVGVAAEVGTGVAGAGMAVGAAAWVDGGAVVGMGRSPMQAAMNRKVRVRRVAERVKAIFGMGEVVMIFRLCWSL